MEPREELLSEDYPRMVSQDQKGRIESDGAG